ncbi:hypothetical protein BH11VER1_BH11VER1_02060 [soil metagenome]
MSNPTTGWHIFTKAQDLMINPGGLLVRFADGRSHLLRVIESEGTWLLRGLVVQHAHASFDRSPALAAALKNRHYRLCGLRVDEKASLVAESHVPKAGLTATEFQLLARNLAAECDRLEYLITGRDREGM